MYIHTNPNPNGVYVEDCVVRAIAIVTGRSWDDIYAHLCKTMKTVRWVEYSPDGLFS